MKMPRSYRQSGAITETVLGALCVLSGCGDVEYANSTAHSPASAGAAADLSPTFKRTSAPASRLALNSTTKSAAPGKSALATPEDKQAAADLPKIIPRKIIYNARLTLVVESIATLGDKLAKLVKESDAYIADTDQTSYTHAQRTASWTIRIPVEGFDEFLKAVGKFGEVQQHHLDSQDVTQEYVDTEARISNKQKEESRLQKHLDESTGKLEDILAVERELTRVRGEIETMQGRIRYLANLSTLSTVTITATEVQDYVPPVQPTIGTRIARTFQRSVENLGEFLMTLVLAVVALLPWVPIVLVLALPLVVILRSIRRRRAIILTTTGTPTP